MENIEKLKLFWLMTALWTNNSWDICEKIIGYNSKISGCIGALWTSFLRKRQIIVR